MATIKRLFTFIGSIGLICAGLYVFYAELFVSFSHSHGRSSMFAFGLVLISCGAYQLWFEFLLPALIRRRMQ